MTDTQKISKKLFTVPAPDLAYRHVLVALDGSEFADAAVPTARALSARLGADLHAISVATSSVEAEALRAHAASTLELRIGDDRVHVTLAADPADAIHERAAQLGECLVCMSSHGRGRVGGAAIGSIAQRVLGVGDAPIVVVGPTVGTLRPLTSEVPTPLAGRRLVACVDGGGDSEQVLSVGAAWARALGMTLTVVTVAEPVIAPLRQDRAPRGHGRNVDAGAYLHDLVQRWPAAPQDVQTHVVYDPVSAADGLRTYADEEPVGLLAVATHARSGMDRVFHGAIAADIVASVPVPVLVVRVPES